MSAAEQWQQVRRLDSKVKLTMGPNSVDRYLGDPKRYGFMLARYAVAAKIVKSCSTILDVGCGSGDGTLTFLSDTKAHFVWGVDYDKELIDFARAELWTAADKARGDAHRLHFSHGDFVKDRPTHDHVEAVVSLDCIEHIDAADTPAFLSKIADILTPDGLAVIGTPNENAAKYASAHSACGHINNFTPERLEQEMSNHFSRVIMISMNDSVAHFGFLPMAHYIIAIGF